MDNYRNTQLAEQISRVTGKPIPPRTRPKKAYGKRGPRKDNYNPRGRKDRTTTPDGFILKDKRDLGKEGVGHINCTDESTTELGRALSLQHYAPFKHKYVGPFKCMEGFMWYLCSEDDGFRTMSGPAARNASRKLTREQKTSVNPYNLYKLLVADAFWQSINSRGEKFISQIKSSTLPFDMYYVDRSGIRIRTARAEWQVHVLEIIRSAIKQNLTYPHFFYLFNEHTAFGMKEVLGIDNANESDPQQLSREYEIFVSGLVLDHFKDLIDIDKVATAQLKAQQKEALAAAKEILTETERAFSESEKHQGDSVTEAIRSAFEAQDQAAVAEVAVGEEVEAEVERHEFEEPITVHEGETLQVPEADEDVQNVLESASEEGITLTQLKDAELPKGATAIDPNGTEVVVEVDFTEQSEAAPAEETAPSLGEQIIQEALDESQQEAK